MPEIEVYRRGIQLADRARVTRVGLELSGEMSAETWEAIGAQADFLRGVSYWVIGDWARYGAEHFPEEYRAALERYDAKTIRVCREVAERFPDHAVRARFVTASGEPLSFQHFGAVAWLPEEVQAELLQRAADEGLSTHAFRRLTREHRPPTPANTVADLPDRPSSREGAVYRMGPHRLVCGDARDPRIMERLFRGQDRAAMVWTDPPYGVSYTGQERGPDRTFREVLNDDQAGLYDLLHSALTLAKERVIESAPFYVAGPQGPNVEIFLRAFRESGWTCKQQLIWVKDSFVLGRSDYHLRHESVFYGNVGQPVSRMHPNPRRWFGDDARDSVFQVSRPRTSDDHPTMKPVELITPMIANSSRAGDVVLDMFAGAGSTMVAAAAQGRRAFLVELDPGYCDVIRQRWASLPTRLRRG